MRKGIALQTIILLILALISLAVAIIILIKSGLLSNLQTILCSSITTYTFFIRGLVIKLLWDFYGLIIFFMIVIMITYAKSCTSSPISGAYCMAVFLVFVAVLLAIVVMSFSKIPSINCPNPAIKVGTLIVDCGDSQATDETLMKEIATRIVDCWGMYARGKYDPLAGITPPNPRTCYIINFNIGTSITVAGIEAYMKNHQYPNGNDCAGDCLSFWNQINGSSGDGVDAKVAMVRTNNYIHYVSENNPELTWYNKQLKAGRIFIKYYDSFFWTQNIRDADCFTDSMPGTDSVYLCIDEHIACDANCKLAVNPANDCSTPDILGS